MPPHTLDFLEEPIRDECPEAYEALRKMTDVPLAIGEEFVSKWQFLPYIERGITNYARVDICNVGGFTEAIKVAGWCEAHYINLMPHNPLGPVCTAATVHLAAAVPNFAWTEVQNNAVLGRSRGRGTEPVFPEQMSWRGIGTRCRMARAWASRSTKRCSTGRSSSTKCRTCTNRMARTPIGSARLCP